MDRNHFYSRQEATEQNPQPPVEPVPAPQPSPEPAKNIKNKKPLIIGLIVAAALVIIGGGALAYNLWYQNPDKVLSDSLSNLVSRDSMSGKSSVDIDADGSQATIDVTNKVLDGRMSVAVDANIENEDTALDLSGNAVYDKDNTIYIKVNNADSLLDTLIEAQVPSDVAMTDEEKAMATGMMRSMFEPIVEEVDGQWIRIDPEETSENDDVNSDAQCGIDAFNMLSDDKSVRDELAGAYKDNRFMVPDEKLGSKDGNLGFTYILDEDIAESFGEAVEKTKLGKKLASCNEDADTGDESYSDIQDNRTEDVTVKLEVWVNRWSHQLASMSITATADGGDTVVFDHTPNYDEDIEVNIPTDSITLDELSSRLEGAFSL